ncbi:hypothetical protein Dimus_022750 [Dionaea muscipula]
MYPKFFSETLGLQEKYDKFNNNVTNGSRVTIYWCYEGPKFLYFRPLLTRPTQIMRRPCKAIYRGLWWVYFLKHKNDVFETFKQWKILIEKQNEKMIKGPRNEKMIIRDQGLIIVWNFGVLLRTDNNLKFCSGEFYKNEGICKISYTYIIVEWSSETHESNTS